MSKTTPTQRTLQRMRKNGFTVAVVERWNAHAKVRHDLFGFIDILALNGESIIGIQATSRSNVSARVKKIQAEPRAMEWLNSGGKCYVWGWGKMANGRWEVREIEVTKEMLQPVA